MDQGTDDERREDEELLEAVVAPVAAVAAVRDDETGELKVLALDDRECKPLVLSGTASVIWDELDGVRSLRTIVADLAADYELDEQVIGDQVVAFVTQLLSARLLQTRDSAGASA
ncbi:PqqD family protein [Pseudoclavibacter sp. RFBA6]|uniref:PqqD family protein n=1 Tax=Pseudoclavibacter sp. RFBA6 TaxID=2080573 RepID=UPI000CE90B4F|nr:PqqD family protein [Pseudoclavibacter sp. RFBA6]PPG42704.1 hypothetical protein C5C17_02535 [Pseudoclavibacter sp. RFBA6]